MKKFLTHSADETVALGRLIGARLHGGDVIAYRGGLGAGKTTITHGIAQGMGLKDDVSSPTFALVNEYRGKINLYHFDMYRINGGLDLETTGFYDYMDSDSVLAIEWSENISDELPLNVITISISRIDDETREIEINGDERFDDIGN
ncbi:MAG: tRNA (adenosine(37)-N6)-threonylcarbamoyltransferase complex ATPase subunit type 1 TsaE [Oscillospiraceae bacterium]|nr:tRNA (adenosine(37)-N6)-threonylcarbamoyltransferase complex ATPase subunit type 1 TsaE [Oscillospiraceae bacterium]